MKPVIIKIICWVAGIGVVGYVGLTIANSFPGISGLVGKVPVINSIPTLAIDGIAEATMLDGCKSDFREGVEVKVVRISDAPESEGSYHRWECVAQNPNGTEEEYQKYQAATISPVEDAYLKTVKMAAKAAKQAGRKNKY